MYLLVAHATLASCDCPFAQARCHARAAAAASHAGYTQGWIFIFLSFRSLEARRPPSNEGARKCCVGLSSGGQVRSEPDWRLERMNWDFSCCRSIWEALVWAASLLQGLPCTYVIGPSKLKHFFHFLHCLLMRWDEQNQPGPTWTTQTRCTLSSHLRRPPIPAPMVASPLFACMIGQ